MGFFFLCLGLHLLLSQSLVAQDNSIVLRQENEVLSIAQNITFFTDSTNALHIGDIVSADFPHAFSTNTESFVEFTDNIDFTYWLKIQVENQTDANEWVIEIPYSKLPFVSWYTQKEGKWVEFKDGFEVPASERFLQSRFPAISLYLEKGQSETIYVKISSFNLSFPVHIETFKTYVKKSGQRDMAVGIILSLMGFMVIVIFFFYIVYRLKSFFVFGLYALASAFYILSFEGFLPPLPFAQLIMILSILFTVSFYNVEKHSLTIVKFSRVLTAYFTLFFVVSILMRYSENRSFVPFALQINYLAIHTPFILFLSFYALKKGENQARVYLLGVAMQMIFVAAEVVALNLGYRRFLVNFVSIGFFLEMLIFGLALLFRAYIERKELLLSEQKAQEKSLEAARENTRLVRNQNKMLEEKVSERTLELEKQKDHLSQINQQLEAFNKEKDFLMGVISHDIRSPFMGVVGFCDVLSEEVDDLEADEIRDLALRIQKNANEVLRLFENLMEWSQLELQETAINTEEVKVFGIVDDIARMYELSLTKKGIEIRNECNPKIHLTTDPTHLSTILRNLISNAIKFTPSGKNITISTQQNQNELTIIVQDQGVGIPPEKLQRLFEFDKSKSTQGTNQETGTGLGLMVSKRYLEKIGGSISVDSELGIGTTFYLIFEEKAS